MTKILHIEIERCGDCPYYDNYRDGDYKMHDYCTQYGIQDIDNTEVVPDFCRLDELSPPEPVVKADAVICECGCKEESFYACKNCGPSWLFNRTA